MARKTRHDAQDGFTLIELLVVVLIIGILAAIAIPSFLGQRSKGQDAKAKANARNLVSQMEVCFRNTDGYVGCAVELTTEGTSLPMGSGPGQVQILNETETGYQIQAISESDLGGANHVFTITQNFGGVFDRTCEPLGEGGCKEDGTW